MEMPRGMLFKNNKDTKGLTRIVSLTSRVTTPYKLPTISYSTWFARPNKRPSIPLRALSATKSCSVPGPAVAFTRQIDLGGGVGATTCQPNHRYKHTFRSTVYYTVRFLSASSLPTAWRATRTENKPTYSTAVACNMQPPALPVLYRNDARHSRYFANLPCVSFRGNNDSNIVFMLLHC